MPRPGVESNKEQLKYESSQCWKEAQAAGPHGCRGDRRRCGDGRGGHAGRRRRWRSHRSLRSVRRASTSPRPPSRSAARVRTPPFFMMQKIGDMYTGRRALRMQAGHSAAGQTCSTGALTVTANAQVARTASRRPLTRHHRRRRQLEPGRGERGRQRRRLRRRPEPAVRLRHRSDRTAVDFARSSKPSAGTHRLQRAGARLRQGRCADRRLPDHQPVDLRHLDLRLSGQVAGSAYPNGGLQHHQQWPGRSGGHGWLPGDNPAGTANHGTKLAHISNVRSEGLGHQCRLPAVV